MLKIKDNVDLKELEKFGFSHNRWPLLDEYEYEGEEEEKEEIKYDDNYTYEFLRVDTINREIYICSGYDEVNGSLEIIKLYDLIKNDLIEKIN